jgi:hypothetical protein
MELQRRRLCVVLLVLYLFKIYPFESRKYRRHVYKPPIEYRQFEWRLETMEDEQIRRMFR